MPAGRTVVRQRLIEALERGRHRRLTLIHAPAGFGKTTLATQWRDQLTAEGRAVAWIGIDPSDNEPIWLLTHLIEAIRAVRPELAAELLDLLEQHPDDTAHYVLPTLINEIDRSAEPLVIVVDDWHRVTDPQAAAVIEFLLEHASPLLQLFVLSRTRTDLPLGRLRVRRQLVEVDAAALRFDSTESEQLLFDLNGFPLTEDEISGLLTTTDGWAAALKLASLSLRTAPDWSDLLKSITKSQESIEDYLADNVLNQLPQPTLDFLLRTALPERLSAGLASTLTGQAHGQAWLEQIEAADLFLHPLDRDRIWFGYHHLFVVFLRRRLRRDHPDEVDELHRRASAWFAAHDLTGEAVHHALAGNEPELAVDIVEDRAKPLFEQSRISTLLTLVDRLPPELVAERPNLQIALGWTNVLLQRPAKVFQALTALERGRPGQRTDDDQLLEVRLLRSCVEVYQDRLAGVAEVTTECLQQAHTHGPWVLSVAANMESMVSLRQLDLAAVRQRQAWALPSHERAVGALPGVIGQCISALAALEQLDVAATRQILFDARDWALRAGDANSYLVKLVSGQIGALMYELGDLAEAEAGLEHSHELGEIGMVEFLLTSHVTTARLKARRGDLEAAHRHLIRGAEVARKLDLIRLTALVHEEEARLGLPASGPPPTVPERTGPVQDWLVDAVEDSLTTACVLRSLTGGARPAAAAVPQARDLLTRTESRQQPMTALRARILLAAALFRSGKPSSARDCLAPAMDICNRTGLVGPLADGGAPIAELLRTMSDQEQRPQLTDRELQILKLLAAGLSNQQIAEAVDLSPNTVKWYLKTLYQKLGATRRQECVAMARSLSLVL